MNRITAQLSALRARGEVALVVYLTAGDPHRRETAGLVLEAARAGADVIELGVPFSDPSADGPVIQRAMERALGAGEMGRGTLDKALEIVRAVRAESQVPLVLFGYCNPLVQRGLSRVAADARAAGVDGLLVVDLPPEESGELDAALAAEGLVRVPLIAPTTSLERARVVVERGGGFAYYVALTGVTGAGHLDPAEVGAHTAVLRPALGELPLAIGFGVKEPSDARALAPLGDAVVVGSALVEAVAAAPDATARLRVLGERVRALKAALARS